MYKNKIKAYCMMCRKDTENIDTKIVRKKKQTSYAIKMFCFWN